MVDMPVLEPNLHLARAESWDLARKALPVCGVWMGLLGELAHEESRLLVREPAPTPRLAMLTTTCARDRASHLKRFIFRRAANRSAAV